jgi:ubiquinone/menaquinone biosynthesis C-methylase UbiE
LNEEAHYWEDVCREFRKSPLRLWRHHSDAVNNKLLEQWLPKEPIQRLIKTDVFDEALGDGLYPLLALRAKNVVGIDISPFTLHAAVAHHDRLSAVGADANRLPFVDEAFEVVVSNSTLDHFESCEELIVSLRELYRVLKAGGLLIITLDNLANPVIALRNALPFRLVNRLGIVPYYVGATTGPRGLRRMLQQVEFKILEVDAVMHCPRVLAVWAARILERHAGTGIQKRFLKILMSFERLSHWRTRFLTGYFLAVKAIK